MKPELNSFSEIVEGTRTQGGHLYQKNQQYKRKKLLGLSLARSPPAKGRGGGGKGRLVGEEQAMHMGWGRGGGERDIIVQTKSSAA